MTARADAAPAFAQATRVLEFYASREDLHRHAEECEDAEEYDAYAEHLDDQAHIILCTQPTCMADVAAQVLTATEHGERGLNADMIERLRKLVTEAGQ